VKELVTVVIAILITVVVLTLLHGGGGHLINIGVRDEIQTRISDDKSEHESFLQRLGQLFKIAP